MRKRVCAATDCGKEFIMKMPHAKYCSDQCRSREHKRRSYQERKNKGLCPQCGSEMLQVNQSPQYCEKCQKYFRDRYIKNKIV